MAVNLTIAAVSGTAGLPYPAPNGLIAEDVTITGASSVANDTGTYTTQYVKNPLYFRGAFDYSFSGQVLTLTDKMGIGTGVQTGTILGTP